MYTPEYTIELYDIHGNYILDISRFTTLSYSLVLNDAESAKFNLDLHAFEQLCHSLGLLPRNVLYPARTEVRIRRNGTTIVGLRVVEVSTSLDDDSKKLSVTCDGYLNYFARRIVYPNTWSNTDRSVIAWQAIHSAQSQTSGDLGITQGTLATVGSLSYVVEYESVKSVIQNFTAGSQAYDFEFTANKQFNTYTRKGSDKPHIELLYSGRANDPSNTIQSFTVPRQSDTLANRIIGHSRIGSSTQESIRNHIPSQQEYLIHEHKESFRDFSTLGELNNATQSLLEQSYGMLVVPDVTLYSGAFDLETLQTGDSVRVHIEQDSPIPSYNDDIDGLFRINEINVSVDSNGAETVKLAFFNPDGGGEIRS